MKASTLLRPVCALVLALAGTAWAQVASDDPDWQETDVPPPPAFDIGKLVTFEVSSTSALVYGVDPASVTISRKDSVVRYVVVATSPSGARNVMYEGLRCATGEYKVYGRYSADGQWTMVSQPEWRSLFGNMPSHHAMRFARAGACDSAAPAPSVAVLVSRLKNVNFRLAN